MISLQNYSDLVYSTAGGKMCASCGKPMQSCICREEAKKKIAKGDGTIRIGRETKGRKGKGVTIVTGLPLSAGELIDLAKDLKKKCGCGGTVKEGIIEIQGDMRDRLVDELTRQGYKVKRAGG
jgi:translation initiation factor 1